MCKTVLFLLSVFLLSVNLTRRRKASRTGTNGFWKAEYGKLTAGTRCLFRTVSRQKQNPLWFASYPPLTVRDSKSSVLLNYGKFDLNQEKYLTMMCGWEEYLAN
jgi:hypothetical protein